MSGNVRRRLATGSAAFAGSLLLGALSFAATVDNGGFEAGHLRPWKQTGNAGGWTVYSGKSDIGAPPRGEFAAKSFSKDPSSNLLYRRLRLPRNSKVLKLIVYYANAEAGAFHTPRSLSRNVHPNQQYRIDLIKKGAKLRSMKPADILINVFRTRVGDPVTLSPTTISKRISGLAGRTVKFRAAEVDNLAPFSAGIDAVRVKRR